MSILLGGRHLFDYLADVRGVHVGERSMNIVEGRGKDVVA